MNSIRLNDILRLENLDNVKIRFNLMFQQNWNPIEIFKNGDISTMLRGQYWNYNKNKSFKAGQITVGLVKIKANEDDWLLFHIGQVTKDLNKFNDVGYDFKDLPEYEKYVGRLIVKFKNKAQTMIRNAESVMDDCYISQILPDTFDNDLFPGYEKVNITWDEMNRVLEKGNWKTALENQKGVYLMTDMSNGKMYVGWDEANEEVENNFDSYVEIEKMDTHESFRLMEKFIDSVDEFRQKEKFEEALRRPRPFGNFKFEINNSGLYRQKWFDFKKAQMIEWVKGQLIVNDV